ncbi:MAG: DEAD/DEAH box helicase [Bacteroidaceae bacterium]|nr:DEAD/DEAH box helicase [Bacteroidaceae bacterium]
MKLRDYQQDMLVQLRDAWTKHQSVMVQMPTGTGKTRLMAEVIRTEKRKEKSEKCGILIVAHRIELIGQISRTLDRFGIEHGLIVSGKPTDKTKRVQVASIQTLSHRLERTDNMDSNGVANNNFSLFTFHFSLIIVDEAHHAVAKTYRLLWERWPEAKFLGLTATPCRMNNTGFTDLFDTLLQSCPIQEFIDKGWLSDFEYISVTPDNWMVSRIAGLKKRGADGDYQTKEMATVMDTQESIEHLYQSYNLYVKGKKGIVYAINREHAWHISDYYASKGVRCCWIEAKTPTDVRRQLVDDYRNGKLDVIVNVDIFSEGFDCPEVEFIQLARPTLSLSKYLQQVGRGMRVVSLKDYVTVLDQVGMYQNFGMPTEERDWDLMFTGKVAGKCTDGNGRRYIIRNESDLKLLNLEMVRIKRHGEKSDGIEIFIEGGKYGILNDGKVICAPEFEKVTRLDAPYFAMGVYPFYVFRNRVDIIGMDGRVLRPELYGNVHRDEDVFIGKDITGRTDYWDAKGGRHYRVKPTFDHIERFEVARVGEQVYMRQFSKQWEKPIDMNNIYVHDAFFIIGNMLIFRNDVSKVYEVCGYENWCIHIKGQWRYDRTYPYACIGRLGNISSYEKTLPSRLSPKPVNMVTLGMKRFFKKQEPA